MNRHSDMRSFEEARRRQLIEATIDAVADLGFRAASLSEIARRANVSQGLFAHYFGDKEGLLEATLRHMAARLPRRTAAKMRDARTALERVHAVCDSALDDEEFERRTSAVWLAFWGQIVHSEPYRRVQAIYQRRTRSNLRHGLRDLVAADQIDHCATLIAATIDGLWLQSHAFEDEAAPAAHARRAVHRLTATLIAAHGAAAAPAPAAPPAAADRAAAIWGEAGLDARAETLRRIAEEIRADRAAILKRHVRETGLPASDTEKHDLPRVIRAFERAAAAAARPPETRVAFGRDAYGHVEPARAEPVVLTAHDGMALAEILRPAAAAFAAGRAVVVRAPRHDPPTLARLAEAFGRAGAPDGLFTLVSGLDGAGHSLTWDAAATRPPKAAAVVTVGTDLGDAAAALMRGPRAWAQARSFSETILLVEEPIRQAFLERLVREAASLAVGDPRDPDVEVGPLRSRDHLDRALAAIEEARAVGGRVRLGGREHETPGRNRAVFLKPTVLELAGDRSAAATAALDCPIFPVLGFERDAELHDRLGGCGVDRSLVLFGPDHDRLFAIARAAGSGRRVIADRAAAPPPSAEDWLMDASVALPSPTARPHIRIVRA